MEIKKRWSKLHITIKIGLIILVLGISPLLIGILGDKLGLIDIGSGLGFGLLFFITFWPSVILIIIGIILSAIKRRKNYIKKAE